jgi:hypothetical protein
MLKAFVVLLLLLTLVGFVTRSRRLRRGLWIAFALIVVYAVLKSAGVIEAMAPSRDGVF